MTNEEKPCDYLSPSSRPTDSDDTCVTRSDHADVVDWMYTIVEKYRIDLEMVAMAMGIVDRFLSTPSSFAQDALRNRMQFELVAIAALSICIKTSNKTLPGSYFLTGTSHGVCNEIKDMESNIRQSISPGIYAPTSIQIATHLLSLALPNVHLEESRWNYLLDDVRFQLEYAVGDYYFTTHWPRTVAMAAILNSLDELWGQDRQMMLRAFPPIVNENFSSLVDVLATKDRLRVEMERGHTSDVTNEIIESIEKALADKHA